MAVLAASDRGGLFNAPDFYMKKLAAPPAAKGKVDIRKSATENIASLEFATEVLGAKVLYVLGHTSCGAVTAAAKGAPVPGQISALFQHIRPAVRAAKGDVEAAIRENVRLQAQTLVEGSTVISSLVSSGKVIVAGGVFDLQTGRVEGVDLA
jgi:carbonic anhydrase